MDLSLHSEGHIWGQWEKWWMDEAALTIIMLREALIYTGGKTLRREPVIIDLPWKLLWSALAGIINWWVAALFTWNNMVWFSYSVRDAIDFKQINWYTFWTYFWQIILNPKQVTVRWHLFNIQFVYFCIEEWKSVLTVWTIGLVIVSLQNNSHCAYIN